jgi:CRP/FNR family cyclic AMP-dependent transcriptional regulator
MIALFAVIQGSHALGANAADALFFLRYGVDDLPLMILLSGPAVMVGIVAHSAGLARQGASRWLLVIMPIASAWVAVLWASVFADTRTVYPVIWISTQVLIYLTLTVMWNAAGSACTSRQAKRLFPVFASAAVGGGVVGNLMVGPLATLIGTQNLLLGQGLLLIAASLLVRRVARFFAESREEHASVRVEMTRAMASIRSSRLLKLAALVVFLLFALFFLVVFPFSEIVTAEFTTEAEVAGYLGLFSSVATAATFLFSLFGTSKLFARFGLVLSLSIVPMVYLLGFGVWAVAFGLFTATIVRGMQWVAVNSVQTTAYSALFNVLSPGRRGPVMALMTAVPAQMGTMAGGAILLSGESLSRDQLFIVGLGMAAVAVAIVATMRPAYVSAVVAAVRRGLVGIFEVPATGLVSPVDRDVTRVLESHLSDPRPQARAIAAAGLGQLGDESSLSGVQPLLDDDNPTVRAAAFESMCRIEPSALESHLAVALADESVEVRLNAIGYLASRDPVDISIAALAVVLEDPDPRVRAAAAWLAGGEPGEGVVEAMLMAGDVDSIRAVLGEAARHPRRSLGVSPEDYIDHDDPGVRASAVTAFVQGGGEPARIRPLLDDKSPRVRQAAAAAMSETPEGRDLLISVLQEGSVLATESALRAITPFEDQDARFTGWAAREASRAAYLAGLSQALDGGLESLHGHYLIRVLDGRVDRLVRWVLLAMTTSRTRDVMPVVARGVDSADPETRSQAAEALESVGERSVLKVLLPLLEPEVGQVSSLGLRESLEDLAGDFDPWLSALAARCIERDFDDRGEDGSNTAVSDVASFIGMSEEPLDTLDEMGRVLVMQRVPMFAGLDPEDLVLVARYTEEVTFEEGHLVYREGEAGTELLVVVDGSAVVSRTRDGLTRVIETYEEGEHVGELSLLTGGPRSADVHAGPDGLHGLVISKAELVTVLEERPAVAMGMLGTLAERLVEQT